MGKETDKSKTTSKSKSKDKKKTEGSESPKKASSKSKEKEKKVSKKSIKIENTGLPSQSDNSKSLDKSALDNSHNLEKLDQSAINLNKTGILRHSTEKCEGCFEMEGHCFCLTCEKVYCKTCEDHIHNIPANRNHERVNILDVPHLKKFCYHHNLVLKYFCESCEDPVCLECHTVGPHNNKLHRISNVIESFRQKFNYISGLVSKNLTFKLEQLINQMQHLEFNIEKVKYAEQEIEKDIRSEYTGILETLRGEEGKKLGILQNESILIQGEIAKISELIQITKEIAFSDNPDILSFLLRYRKVAETMEACLAKPLRTNLEIKTNDFPRQLEEQKVKIQHYEKMEKLLELKDDIIWNIVSGAGGLKETAMNEKALKEVAEWEKLSNRHENELKKYNLQCMFCGCFLEENTVNYNCPKNLPEFTQNIRNNKIPNEIVNTKRHFFANPELTAERRTSVKNNESSVQMPKEYNKSSVSLKDYNQDFSECILRIGNILKKYEVNIYKVLLDYDKDFKGTIRADDIRLALMKLNLKINTKDIEGMLKFFDISTSREIEIQGFVRELLGKYKSLELKK